MKNALLPSSPHDEQQYRPSDAALRLGRFSIPMEDQQHFLASAATTVNVDKTRLKGDGIMKCFTSSGQCQDPKREGKSGEVTGLFGVFGGYENALASRFLSIHFPKMVMKHELFEKDLETALRQASAQAYESLRDISSSTRIPTGATICFIAVRDGHCYCLSAGGGARALVVRASDEESVSGDVTCLASARTQKGRSAKEMKSPRILVTGLDYEDQFILMADDPLWREFEEHEIVSIIQKSLRKAPECWDRALEKLTIAALQKGILFCSMVLIVLNAEAISYSSALQSGPVQKVHQELRAIKQAISMKNLSPTSPGSAGEKLARAGSDKERKLGRLRRPRSVKESEEKQPEEITAPKPLSIRANSRRALDLSMMGTGRAVIDYGVEPAPLESISECESVETMHGLRKYVSKKATTITRFEHFPQDCEEILG
eukprot:CAMPEP_0198331338 /NCGR_PEP_ID=MMETSP1450-20131203/17528_1 /TAXON_ID=753684 ORGANISM="Madagascaria erythrocladiodes, Strain CCMP3234" /NCGR_SAMPLE_ID=MMETSP1450 /ASSEMBLY_ACC=CAM_ASM_001115 /LENGTH=430 /DNA_ID=CAMNT_0044035703 /DNA_START=129 /DNA_END=1421 /DNA_ORIENTATION=+